MYKPVRIFVREEKMEVRNYRYTILVICVSLLLGLGLSGSIPRELRQAEAGISRRLEPTSRKRIRRRRKNHQREEAKDPDEMTAEEFEASLNFQRGKITIKEGLATLDVPAGFRYLSPEQSELVLVKAWGNPPGGTTLGMLFPTAISPLSDEGWGVVITYQDDGYIKDDDAETIDYGDLMKQMQGDLVEENEERKQQGFEAVTLIGWAASPRYDRASHKLYWAKGTPVW
jgi:uncharacterized membrane-anchored protein